MSGRGFHALGAGFRSIIDIMNANEERKRQDARQQAIDADRSHTRSMEDFMRSMAVNDAGGYVEDAPVNGAPMFQAKAGTLGGSRRPVSVSDFLDSDAMSRVRIDPMQSVTARLKREKDAEALRAREAAAKLFDDPAESSAALAGVPPAEIRTARPPKEVVPRNPVMGSPEWKDAQQFLAQTRAQYRAPTSGGASRQPTEFQRKSQAFLMMAEGANNVLDEMEASGKKVPTLMEKAGAAVGRGAGNYLTSDEYRRMKSAGLSLSDAWLRFTSGAAVPETEVQRFALSFLAEPGDDDQVLADKKARRQRIIDALRNAGGPTTPETGEGKEVITSGEYDALKSKGWSDAAINAKYSVQR